MSVLGATRRFDFVKSICPNVPDGVFTSASPVTYIDGRGAVRIFDVATPGPGIAITASKTTFYEGRGAVRLIDKVFCGRIVTSSKTTFIT